MIDFRAASAGPTAPATSPLGGILASLAGEGGAILRASPGELLAHLCAGPAPGRPLVVAAGATPGLVEAACELAATGVTIVPPDRDGLPERASLLLALDHAGPGARCLLPLASPVGALAEPAFLHEAAGAAEGGLILDIAFAAFEPALELAIPWPGTAALLGPERPFLDGAREPWLALEIGRAQAPPSPVSPPEGAETVLAWDEWIRSALEARDGIVTWPRGRESYAPGVITFAIDGWPAREAAAILEESFGLLVDAGRPTATPLPGAPDELLRVFPSARHREEDVEALVGALWRVAETRRPDPVAH